MSASNSQPRPTTLDPRMVEAIVREVLERIGLEGVPAETPAITETTITGLYVVTARVVTLHDLESRPTGTTTVRVAERAVITPAALDYMRDKRLTLSRGSLDSTPLVPRTKSGDQQIATPKTAVPLLVIQQCAGPAAEGVIAQLPRRKLPLAVESTKTVPEALARATAALCDSQRLVCWLTTDVATGLCLANRLTHVRAVSANTADDLLAAAAEVGANLLIVDPAKLGLFPTLRAMERYVARGVNAPPALFSGS